MKSKFYVAVKEEGRGVVDSCPLWAFTEEWLEEALLKCHNGGIAVIERY